MKALVYRGPGEMQLEDMLRPALRDATDAVVRMVKTTMAGKLKPKQLVTHHFVFADILKAYDTFGNAGREHALKVILTNY